MIAIAILLSTSDQPCWLAEACQTCHLPPVYTVSVTVKYMCYICRVTRPADATARTKRESFGPKKTNLTRKDLLVAIPSSSDRSAHMPTSCSAFCKPPNLLQDLCAIVAWFANQAPIHCVPQIPNKDAQGKPTLTHHRGLSERWTCPAWF